MTIKARNNNCLKKPAIDKKAFTTSINILNVFYIKPNSMH